ncbi:MAG: hypothetical protein WC796_05540 [Candidatus Pacearchaeota archaeon]
MIKGKKGIVRIIEVFIAIIIIASVAVFIYTAQVKKVDRSESVYRLETIILDRIASNDTLRNAVLKSDEPDPAGIGNITLINNTIKDVVPSDYVFMFKICGLNQICGLEHTSSYYTKKEIYAREISVSSTLSEYDPKKIRLFIWLKE